MSAKTFVVSLFLLIVVFIAGNSLYIVTETERAVLLTLGRLSDDDIKPGLHVKIPLFQTVRKFEARVLTLDAKPERFLTVEKKSIIVDSFAKWRIIDVGKYYTSTNGEERLAERLLAQRINEGLRNQMAQRSLQEVISGERDLLMVQITDHLNEFAESSLGMEVVDVRVKRIDLPKEVSGPVFNRMRAERAKEAQELRSKGKAEAEYIRADADRKRTELESKAYSESEIVRGEGDAEAANIYASAYQRDPEFYSFIRSLHAYKHTFNGPSDVLLVDPESEFFRYLKDPLGKK